MNILLLLAPFSVVLGLIAVAAFVWTLRAGQYDDIKGSAERILLDDDAPEAGHRPIQPSGQDTTV
jgi:cbb3-type cytochrome oxidase maturation protein